eukprot:scaffold301_cov243-Pinguiococcus_pyrenoidosus.AAC.106
MELLGVVDHVVHGEAERRGTVCALATRAPARHAQLRMGVLGPPVRASGLHRHDGHALLEDAELVLERLRIEEARAGHAHDTNAQAAVRRLAHGLGRLHAQADLRAAADEDDLWIVFGHHHVASLEHGLGAGAREVRHALAGERQDRGGGRGRQGGHVGTGHFVAVRGADHLHVGHGAAGLEHLHGLVRRAVLAEQDRVVGGDEEQRELRQGGHAHGAKRVADEVEEGGAERTNPAVRGDAVADRGHAVLSDAEAQIAAHRRALLEVPADLLEVGGAIGRREVRGATDEIRHVACKLGQAHSAQLARGRLGISGLVRREDALPPRLELPRHAAVVLGRKLRMLLRVPLEQGGPLRAGRLRTGPDAGEAIFHFALHREVLVGVEAELRLPGRDVLHAKGRSMGLFAAFQGAAEADPGLDLDDAGLVVDGLGRLDRCVQRGEIVAVGDGLDVPAVGGVAHPDVLGEGQRRVSVDGDGVVVVEHDELAEAQVASEGAGFGRDAFLQAAVPADDPGVVVHDVEARLVEHGREMALGDGHANGLGNALAKGTGADFDSRRELQKHAEGPSLAGDAADLAEALEVVHRETVAAEEEHGVLKRARMPVAEHKAITRRPVRMRRRVAHEVLPKEVRKGRAAQGRAGVARVGRLNHVDTQSTDCVDASRIQRVKLRLGRRALGALARRMGAGAIRGSLRGLAHAALHARAQSIHSGVGAGLRKARNSEAGAVQATKVRLRDLYQTRIEALAEGLREFVTLRLREYSECSNRSSTQRGSDWPDLGSLGTLVPVLESPPRKYVPPMAGIETERRAATLMSRKLASRADLLPISSLCSQRSPMACEGG